jgi:hypothetical protein
MNHPFNASSGPILVDAEISGPAGKARATLVLDTGATASIRDQVLTIDFRAATINLV